LEKLADLDNLLDREFLTTEIIEILEVGLANFRALMVSLNEKE